MPQRLVAVCWVAAEEEQDSNQGRCGILPDISYTEVEVEGSLRIAHSMASGSMAEGSNTKLAVGLGIQVGLGSLEEAVLLGLGQAVAQLDLGLG